MSQEPAVVLRSLAEGMDSFVLKDAPPRELLDAILATANGSVVLSAAASESVRVAASSLPSTDPLVRLDARDREILSLFVEASVQRRSRRSCSFPRRRSGTAHPRCW